MDAELHGDAVCLRCAYDRDFIIISISTVCDAQVNVLCGSLDFGCDWHQVQKKSFCTVLISTQILSNWSPSTAYYTVSPGPF